MKHILLFALLWSSSLNALSINGSGSLKHQTIAQDFVINGAGDISDTTIKGKLDVNGAVKVKDSKLNDLNVNGSFSGESVIISGETVVQGEFSAKNCTFHNITITSESSTLEDCTAEEITIKPIPEKDQIVEIKGTSRIRKVTFESKRGIIKRSLDSIVNETSGIKAN